MKSLLETRALTVTFMGCALPEAMLLRQKKNGYIITVDEGVNM